MGHPSFPTGRVKSAATARALAPTLLLAAHAAALPGCYPPEPSRGAPVTPSRHRWFPITQGTHALGRALPAGPVSCDSCHPAGETTFTRFECVGCHAHQQQLTGRLHYGVAAYAWASTACYQCHPRGERVPYDHAGITGGCADCHAEDMVFAALPLPGFTHMPRGSADCGGCHVTATWKGASAGGGVSHDPARDVVVDALVPTFTGRSITSVWPSPQALPMLMNHATAQVPPDALGACAACHPGAEGGSFYPGEFHAALAARNLPQPWDCGDCHGAEAAPAGFVGDLTASPPRTPATGEMRHDAVAWDGDAPAGTPLVTQDCAVCHTPPGSGGATWADDATGAGRARFHASLDLAALAQPPSCLDCHANTRPAAVLTPANAALPGNLAFDHGMDQALADCALCHASPAGAGAASWAGGRFHTVGSAAPATCLPCHEGERPTATAGWTGATWQRSPFDYVTNVRGVPHGGGADCATCHPGPGTGAWGAGANWVGGHFAHGPGTLAATTCIACHTTQRPDVQAGAGAAAVATAIGFDHAASGNSDCFACHEATVTAGRYVDFFNPATGALPGGDWQGGSGYPGDAVIGSSWHVLSVTETTLLRQGATGLVTGMSTRQAQLSEGMRHTSPAVPAQIGSGPAAAPDYGSCWHCHEHTNGVVTAYAVGRFHQALAEYSVTPGGTVAPLPQPEGGCKDCHALTLPAGIVMRGGSNLRPMDHAARFAAAASAGGVTASGVADLPCAACHASSGTSWADGVFHASIGAAVPGDCAACHYPLMADAAVSDTASGTRYAMRHRSQALTHQQCATCHPGALSSSSAVGAASFRPGAFHPHVPAQPAACAECHAASKPATATASSATYTLAMGGTATNGAQWMSHAANDAASRDCAACHAADARASGSAWSKSTAFHARVASPGACAACHGLANGNGSVAGANNNLPAGLTNSTTVTSAAQTAGTGIAAGTRDQLTHADANVAAHDCGRCHTQRGPSQDAAVRGKEWAQAKFHASLVAGAALVMNGTTGRCSNCHLNVAPRSGFAGLDHTGLTSQAGSQDCAACHTWPGTGTAASANWKGASAAPAFITVGGFTIPAPPAATPTTQAGIANLPHPAVAPGASCTTCHQAAAGGKHAKGYDHASALINRHCNACHEAGSDLVGTAWNGATSTSSGAGDTRPFTLASVVANEDGDSMTVRYPKHFYPADCYECHGKPTGTAASTTGTAYRTAWRFSHTESRMANPSTCLMCHPNGIPD